MLGLGLLGGDRWQVELSPENARALREREAAVLRRAAEAMRGCASADRGVRLEVLADNGQLWMALMNAVAEPNNLLPKSLRARLISIGLAVWREMEQGEPDFEFLISINEQIAAGLLGA